MHSKLILVRPGFCAMGMLPLEPCPLLHFETTLFHNGTIRIAGFYELNSLTIVY